MKKGFQTKPFFLPFLKTFAPFVCYPLAAFGVNLGILSGQQRCALSVIAKQARVA
jgi:hypothetical protein